MDGLRIDDLDTPCLAVDLDVFEQNIQLCMAGSAASVCGRI